MKHPSSPLLRFAGVLLASALVCSSALQAQTLRVFPSQFSFGDSLSDNGNLFALTQGTQPPAPYFNGRFSNGPVFTELLRPGLQPAATAPAAVRTNLNFAFAGATAAPGSLVPTLSQQLGLMQQRGIAPAAGDLFTVLAGANDILDALATPVGQSPAGITGVANAAAVSVSGAVQTLLGAGARNILVLNLPNVARTARFTTGSAAPAAPLAQAGSLAFNAEIRTRLGALTLPADARLTLFNLAGFFDHVLANSAALGFSTTEQEYVGRLLAGQNPGDASGYFFWDGIHPTTRVHGLLAQALTEALNPEIVLATASPQGTALLTVVASHTDTLHQRLALAHRAPAAERLGTWFDYTYQQGNRNAQSGSVSRGWTPGFEFDVDAFTLGLDGKISDNVILGVAVTSSRVQARLAARGGFHTRGESAALYGAWHEGAWSVEAAVLYGTQDITGIRRSTLLGGPQTSASTKGDLSGASVRVGREFARSTTARIQPWVELRTSRVEIDRYVESGVPSLNFAFADSRTRSTDAAAGVSLGFDLAATGRFAPLRLNLDGAFRSRLSDNDRTLRGTLADTIAPATALHVGDGNGRSLHLGVRLDGRLGQRWTWSAGYELETRNDGDAGDRISLSLGARW